MPVHETDPARLARRVLMPGFSGITAPEWLRQETLDGLGGVCLFGHNVHSVEQVRALTDELHGLGPLVVSMDEEGGIVSRLGAMPTRPGSRHVGAATLGAADDVALTRAVAAQVGAELREVGVDLDLAPVADVTSNPDNPVIGVRSFGTDPQKVGSHVSAYVHGLRSAGILSCAKHFPGHGDTSTDSHLGLPRIDVDLDTLTARDLAPFAAAVDAGVDVVMTAHIVFSALDPRPATTSAPVLRLLREQLGFDGVITSDAMDMHAMVDTFGLAEGCVQALCAGVDLVCLGNPVLNADPGEDERIFREVHDAILRALAQERLPLDRLQDACRRVDCLVAQALSLRGRPTEVCHTGEADATAAAIALRTTGNAQGRFEAPITVVDLRRRRNVAAGSTTDAIANAVLATLPGSRAYTAFRAESVVEGHAGGNVTRAQIPQSADLIITGSPWLDPAELDALRRLLSTDADAVVICTGWAPDADVLAPARHTILAHGDDLPTAHAIARLLTTRQSP